MFAPRRQTNPLLESDESNDVDVLLPSEVSDTQQWLKARTVLGIVGFFGFAIVYAMRVNLSVAIVAMVNSSYITNSSIDVCPSLDPWSNHTEPERNGIFNWNETQQGIILGSFFYGYVLTQIPGGRLAEIFGSKLVYGLGVLLTSFFTLLSPIAVRYSYSAFIVVRVLEGICEGVTFPSMHAMLARWIPPDERSRFGGLVYAGSAFGSIVSLPVSGWLCTLEYDDGWPLCFYLFGGLGIVWSIGWLFLVYDTPQKHPRICPQEREYIIQSLGPHVDKKFTSVPWKHFAKSLPLWAILVTHCGLSWQFYTLLTELPTYMNNMLHMNLEANAKLNALPYLTSWLGSIVICIFADWLISKNAISRVNSYRLWNSVASIIPSFGILGVAWVGCDQLAVLLLLTITGAFGSAYYAGYQMNHIALSPQYAGTMFGITNTAANLCGFLAPYAIGEIVEGKETLSQWKLVFYLAAAVNLSCNLFYVVFVSAEEEKWSVELSRQNDNSETTITDDSI